MNRQDALGRIKRARDAFYCAAAGYALLTSADTGDEITRYNIFFGETGLRISLNDSPDQEPESGLQISYRRAIDDGGALDMVETVYRQMIIESVDATRRYAKARGEQPALEQEEWFAFAAHLRNAFGHDGLWQFKGSRPLPVTWNYSFTVTKEMEGTPARDFLPWFWGTRLCAQMTGYVSGSMDVAQRPIPMELRT